MLRLLSNIENLASKAIDFNFVDFDKSKIVQAHFLNADHP